MNRYARIIAILAMAACAAPAPADDAKYTFHENVPAGRKETILFTLDSHYLKTVTINDNPIDMSEFKYTQVFKAVVTILEVKDGQATVGRVEMDPSSYSAVTRPQTPTKSAPSPFIGSPITLIREADGSIGSDFKGKASPGDISRLNSCISPDSFFFPDKPVAVGDTWDMAARFTKGAVINPADTVVAQGKLDSVKNVNGHTIAQITCTNQTLVHEEDEVTEQENMDYTLQVDMKDCQIVSTEITMKSTLHSPEGLSRQTKGGTELLIHCDVLGSLEPATQP